MTEWTDGALGDFIAVKHGYAFKGEHFAEEGEEVVLTPGNFPIGGGLRLRPGREKYYTGPYPEEFRLSPGDLLVVMTDLKQSAPILGNPAFVPKDGPTLLHNQRLGLVRLLDGTRIDRRFLYYLLLDDSTRRQLRATATGSTVRHTAPSRICSAQIRVPPLRVQRSIGGALAAIDDLIENNRRRVEVLEEMARVIYREWFAHFRFPGHEDATFVDSDLGPIPEGWAVQPASEALTLKPRLRVDREAEHPFVSMGDVTEHRMWCSPSECKSGSSGAKFQNWDTLFARITPCLENGKTALVLCLDREEVGRGSTEFITLRGASVGPMFTYCLARSDEFRGHAIASMSGASGRQRVRDECFDSFLFAVPPAQLADDFERRTTPMAEMIRDLSRASERLSAIRDNLLPKLVTGKIDVSNLDLDAVETQAAV